MAEAVDLAKLHGIAALNRALRTCADAGRFADGDLAAILAHQQKTGELQQKTRELERVKAEREFYCKQMAELEEHNRLVTDAATKYSLWGQKLFRELATLDPDGAPRRAFDTGSWM